MEYRLLGRTGVRVSPLCLGTWNFGDSTPEAEAVRIMHKAIDARINIVDTADQYAVGECERIVGRALASGRRNTDWIDLYQVHRPVFDVPQEETLRALDDRLVGYVTEQPPYNLLDRRIENELVPLALRYNMGLLPWSPLASGILSGRYKTGAPLPFDSKAARIGSWLAERATQQGIAVAERVAELARRHNLTSSQLALLWVKDQPAVTAPIFGPRTVGHLDEALPVLDMKLGDSFRELDNLVPPGSAVADFHNTSNWMKMKLFGSPRL